MANMLKWPRRLAAAFVVLMFGWLLLAPVASVNATNHTSTNPSQPTPTTTTAPPGNPTTQTQSNNATTTPVIDGTCRQGGILSYIVCPLINAGVETVSKLAGLVQDLLKVRPVVQDPDLYNSWKIFRDFANASFVLVFLAIIIATGLSLSVSAYSLRSILPRLVMAALLVQASFFISAIFVDVGNVLGAGIGGVFNSLGAPSSGGQAVGITTGRAAAGLSGLVAALGAIVAGIIVGWPVILMLLATAVISILGVFITLAARQLIIAVLIILSPLAFVAMILPGTQNYFKLWYKNLTRAILLYPLIIIILSVSGILSDAAAGAGGAFGSGDVSNILASLVPIVAFLSIPATFKMAGSIMSTVSGAVMRQTSGYNSKLRNSQLYKDAKENYKENATEASRDAPTQLGRARGSLGSGNFLRFGKAGERAKAKAYNADFNTRVGDAESVLDNLNWGNADYMHAVLVGKYMKIKDANGKEVRLQARDDKGRLIRDREGNRLQDKYGNDIALNTDKAMKTAAIKQIAAGGGILELGQIHDTIFNRNEGRKGEYRENSVLGDRKIENLEIWFRGVGAAGKMGETIKSLPQTNPGKLVSAFDTLTAENVAGIHQKAAIPYLERILDNRDIVGGPEAQSVRAKTALLNLAQVADNQNLRGRMDAKVALAFKMNAEKFKDVEVKFNGEMLKGNELIYRLVNDQGKVNKIDGSISRMKMDLDIDSDAIDKELDDWQKENFNSEKLIKKVLDDPEIYEP